MTALSQIHRPHRACADCGHVRPILGRDRCDPCYAAWRATHAERVRWDDNATLAAWARDPVLLPEPESVAALVGPETWAEAEAWVRPPPAPPRVGPVAWARLVGEET